MTREQAETFYAVHKARPFFGELVDFMTSGPVVVQVLEGEGAVLKYRDVMGATDPAKAADGTIRKLLRQVDRRKLGAWFGCPGNGGDRDRAVLLRQRNRRLSWADNAVRQERASTAGAGRGSAVNLVQVVDPANIGAFFTQLQSDMQRPAFWLAVGKIIWINVLLVRRQRAGDRDGVPRPAWPASALGHGDRRRHRRDRC